MKRTFKKKEGERERERRKKLMDRIQMFRKTWFFFIGKRFSDVSLYCCGLFYGTEIAALENKTTVVFPFLTSYGREIKVYRDEVWVIWISTRLGIGPFHPANTLGIPLQFQFFRNQTTNNHHLHPFPHFIPRSIQVLYVLYPKPFSKVRLCKHGTYLYTT